MIRFSLAEIKSSGSDFAHEVGGRAHLQAFADHGSLPASWAI